MSKVFVLVNKRSEDYSALKEYGEVEFIYQSVNKSYDEYDDFITRLTKIFEETTTEDKLVLNGPAWLIGFATYLWITRDIPMPVGSSTGILHFNSNKQKYYEVNASNI
jgi:hypothetical protein